MSATDTENAHGIEEKKAALRDVGMEESEEDHVPEGMEEMSPNKRYIRFDETITANGARSSIQTSYKAFDTKNGVEIEWHKISLNEIEESEQQRVTQCINLVKKIESKYVINIWHVGFQKIHVRLI